MRMSPVAVVIGVSCDGVFGAASWGVFLTRGEPAGDKNPCRYYTIGEGGIKLFQGNFGGYGNRMWIVSDGGIEKQEYAIIVT